MPEPSALNLWFGRGSGCCLHYLFIMFASFRSFFFAASGAAILGLSSCGNSQPATAETAAPAAAAKPAAAPVTEARYECPMGCAGSQSSKPGKCPVCEMELEKKS